ncbi:hypothetical protein PHYSODRAFT_256492 [Phytophthora sojae]|uniref:Uncharacterized protein n=1 Tax=Phytophthora sojae (strain P6497) TaxID=1094619 RepID=G4ZF26_PHYSP|nr:hypothetical protein PHYSODRAFT_256492 [Phytophthora sojae]EGZ18457.1 hypothetical protein PHYSODRAFT_256492 [Phytophthora sojae]|eukprot:XP_009527515.1 hypothetical protein PHYSODRAFT_256492 [Phytophthora sojae]
MCPRIGRIRVLIGVHYKIRDHVQVCLRRGPPHATQRRPEIVTTTASAERGSCTPPCTHPRDRQQDVSRIRRGWGTPSVRGCRKLPIDAKTVRVLTMSSAGVVLQEGIGKSGVSGEMVKSEQELEKAIL